ncbi:MAG: hypothetical protein ACMG50_02645 [Thermomonas sp.]
MPRRVLTGLLSLLLLAFVLSVSFRGSISTWLWPDSRSEELQLQANAALKAGQLTQADGSGARELFEAALAVKPDQVQAREGLARVAQAALERAGQEIEQKRYAAARTDLQLAQALDAPREKVDQVIASLHAQATGTGDIAELLARAASARQAGRLDQDQASALPLYQRVLALEPRNQHAVEGREDALTDLLLPAQAALDAGDARTVVDLLRRAQRFDPGHAELPALQAGLARLLEHREQRLDALIDKRRFERAAELCIELRALLDDGLMPTACSNEVVAGLATRAARLAEDFDFVGSEQLLTTASTLAADDARIRDAQHHLAEARRGASKLPNTQRPNRRDTAKVHALLADAAKAQARGDWITPPGESAWDKLLAARALAPADARVQHALAALIPAARTCQADALRDNRLGESQACLDVWRQLDPLNRDLLQARTRLAQRWVAVGDQRLERGELIAAEQAAERARRLDPRTVGLAEFAQRLRRAQPGKP